MLSPHIRHRLISERDVVAAVLAAHSERAAEKFIQEVCWRTYWKGWLEQHPQVWDSYIEALADARAGLSVNAGLAAEIAAAERGDTGIACFDAWVRELVETGYLHNHARMWFASIWIFTLKLPWALGADFFYRHLKDGDPASNTLSWRWVGGLQTRGKTYLARADNIATYTRGRFTPDREDLAPFALALEDEGQPERGILRAPAGVPAGARILLLLTEDDLSPETWPLPDVDVVGVAVFAPIDVGPALSPVVTAFKAGALADAQVRAAARWNVPARRVGDPAELVTLARTREATHCVTAMVPVGYVRPEIDIWGQACASEGIALVEIAHRWDQLFWPHAKAGFFQLKDRIPAVLAKLDLISTKGAT